MEGRLTLRTRGLPERRCLASRRSAIADSAFLRL
jgi:hypothetical protein